MSRDALRSPEGWRMYDQANLIVLAVLGLVFLLTIQGTRRSGPLAREDAATSAPSATVRPATLPASGARAAVAAPAAPSTSDLAAVAVASASVPPLAIDPAGVGSAAATATATAAAPDLAAVSPTTAASTSPATNEAASGTAASRMADAGGRADPAAPRAASSVAAPAATPPDPTTTPPLPASVAALCRAMASGLAGGFEPGRSELDAQGRQRLRQLLPCLTAPRYEVVVHTDSGGDAAANDALTLARAQAVVDELVRQGVPASRLQPRGAGAREPVARNDTARGRRANRRLTLRPL